MGYEQLQDSVPSNHPGQEMWTRGGRWLLRAIFHTSTVQLQLQMIFRYKQSPKLMENVFFSLPQVFPCSYWRLRSLCLYPRTGSGDPQHQMLQMRVWESSGTGESLLALLGHIMPQRPALPYMGVRPTDPDPWRRHPLGEQLYHLMLLN